MTTVGVGMHVVRVVGLHLSFSWEVTLSSFNFKRVSRSRLTWSNKKRQKKTVINTFDRLVFDNKNHLKL